MYCIKLFEKLEEIVEYLNTNKTNKSDIIHIEHRQHFYELVLWESEDNKNDKDSGNATHVFSYGGCYNCDRRGEQCFSKHQNKLCRECKYLATCSRYTEYNVSR